MFDQQVLHLAAIFGKGKVALCLLDEFGCDPSVGRQFGRSLLHLACKGGSVNLVQTLIKDHNADVNLKDDYSDTPLHEAALNGREEVVYCLIHKFNCDPDVRGRYGRSLLHSACKGGSVSLVQTLIQDHNADVNLKDDYSDTPLHEAALNGKEEVALCLINELGCDHGVRGQLGRSVLHSACEGGNVSLVQALMHEHKADINVLDDNGNTPLHVAAFLGKKEVALCLIGEFHCDPNVSGEHGRSLLHSACRGGNVALVQALIRDYNADVNALDDQNKTPLDIAASEGKKDVALCLINDFGCDPNVRYPMISASLQKHSHDFVSGGLKVVRGDFFKSVLHSASRGGSSLVQALIREHDADVNVRDEVDDTPLHVAAVEGKIEVTSSLISEFGCDPNVRGKCDRSVLHNACEHGSVSFVRTLIQKHKADINARDHANNMPLHVAALNGKAEVALCLISEFSCDPNVKGDFGRSVLHSACEGGSISLVRSLLNEFGADLSALNDDGDAPLCLAALSDEPEVAMCLINEFGCDPNVRGCDNRTLLHFSCRGGSLSLVQTLIQQYNADVYARDDTGDTPFHDAAYSGTAEVLLYLLGEFECDSTMKGDQGKSLLHCACHGGNLGLVQTLIQDYKADVSAKDDANDTPIFNAAEDGNAEVVLWLINHFNCNLGAQGDLDKTLLHFACQGGDIALVRSLVRQHEADVSAQDCNGVTPLQIAAVYGRAEVVLFLLKEFGCDVHAKGYLGRSLLHDACEGGNAYLVKILLIVFKFSVLSMDNHGNTPLHTCSSHGQALCVEALLSANAPPLIRNNANQTPVDVAKKGRARVVLERHLLKKHHKLQVDYNAVLERAKKKYSGGYPITRLFVLGYPRAGKSSLVESFKTEGFFRSFLGKIPESSVALHTAGVIPSVHVKKHYGRVLFYDFAGDADYYSSHAAILENLAPSKAGDNLIIIVVDLRGKETTIESSFRYWLSFTELQRFAAKLSFVLVGSHSDMIPSGQMEQKRGILKKIAETKSLPEKVRWFMLDCRSPRDVSSLQNYISNMTSRTSQCNLSENACLLLGLLENDYSNVTACSLQTILSHIEEYELCLPVDPNDLYLTLTELHDIGVLLLLGDPTKGDCHFVLNIPKLTKDVHQALFSKPAIEILRQKFIGSASTAYNVGILPDSVLEKILPSHITKQCLSYLQYCQEIKCEYIGAFEPELAQSGSSFFFFPALCCLNKGDASRVMPPDFSYSIGWLAQCTARDHYFPPRFLHVLLRLIFRFTLPTPVKYATDDFPDHSYLKRRCSMWKTGVWWLMEEGVACQVELVNGNKGVVVITRSTEERLEDCVSVFRKIVHCVMKSKAEFCAPIRPDFFLLDSTEEADYLTEDNFFAMHEVERALTDPEGRHMILSVTGNKRMERSRLFCMRKPTHWDTFFPIDFVSVLRCVDKVEAKYLYNLGLELNMLWKTLDDIFEDFRNEVEARRRKLVRVWLSSSLEPPCWWRLVQALKAGGVESAYLTEKILESFGKLIVYATQ